MSRRAESEIDAHLGHLERLISRHHDGLSRGEIRALYLEWHDVAIATRTLQRWLRRLVEDRRVQATGEGRARLYLPASAGGESVPRPREGDSRAAEVEAGVPLTSLGAEVRALIQRPIMERDPVGYDRAFLERYVPGETWYLPEDLRTDLHERGRTPDPDRPAGTYAREVLGRLLIDLAWASSRLEGNTYSRLDTKNLIEFGQAAEGKDAREAQMILNHKRAIEFLIDDVDGLGFDRRTLSILHATLAENLLSDIAGEGRLRTRMVHITGTTYTPLAIPQALEDCFDRLLEKAGAIPDPFEQAFFSMVHIPHLQPFIDVNKRTSRLAANIPLIKANLCPLSFVDVPHDTYVEATIAVYELERIELLRDLFAWAYERSCAQYRVVREALGEPDPLRLRYRSELEEVVREMVRSGAAPRRSIITTLGAAAGVPESDRAAFAERALDQLLNLHEGSAGRYRIGPGAFRAWRERFGSR